ncbi:M23 family metallopeptidase [Streptomyces sp. N2-109]|uniref:M23 family metallopeptidase n=1 Tax=Streptomyces gossypii TaxID=2883101 RepID=A0ABT2K148_9ACTN|nr:M23 family metallopeptidase [Streptomyces gossypii]MCT2593893.1 M23 family metallopeptidase [Streptomyces gossypii]
MPKNIALAVATKRSRTRAAVIATGLSASLAMGAGAGVAAAAQPDAQPDARSGAQQDAFAGGTATELAGATKKQSDAQYEAIAAHKVAVKKAAVEKAAAAKKKAASWQSPIDKPYTLTADFGNSGDRWSHKHSGQDFGVPTGTPVKAAHKGTVVTTGDGGSYGNRIVIKHENGKYSQYAHLSKINVGVGQHVNTGSKIALSGNTGNTSGPHLHFEIRTTPVYGSGIDPVPFLHKQGVNL